MTTMAGPRKIVSIHDYPEHLNPFADDNPKMWFWSIGRRINRSNSINFSGIKDFRNSWSLRSFRKKGKRENPSKDSKSPTPSTGSSPIVYRRPMQNSSGSARGAVQSERVDHYVYGGSITPLPRSRFGERLRASQTEVNSYSNTPRKAQSDIMGSSLSIESTNPFDEPPLPPVRAPRRKKKQAPLPPAVPVSPFATEIDEKVNNNGNNEELRTIETDGKLKNIDDDIDDVNLNIELKIVEDIDDKTPAIAQNNKVIEAPDKGTDESVEVTSTTNGDKSSHEDIGETTQEVLKSTDNRLENLPFPKVNIERYRRNSSVNEDDIKLRRGNLEDFQSLSNKRSQSLINTSDGRYIAFDLNLNDERNIDINSNEEPQRVVCKLYEEPRKTSIDNSISSTEKEFLEIDRATRELEKELSKLNSALNEDDLSFEESFNVSKIRQRFDSNGNSSPNPIPKPRRSHYGESQLNGNI